MRKISWVPLTIILSLFGLIKLSYICADNISCIFRSQIWSITFKILSPVSIFCLYSIPLAIVLIFIQKNVFKSWLRFAAWWIPLSILLVAITPETGNQAISYSSVINYANTAKFMAILFTIISLGIIGWKTFVSKNK